MEASHSGPSQGHSGLIAIEEVIRRCEALPLAEANTWYTETLIDDRIHLSRGSQGEFVVLIEGDLTSFGTLPLWQGIDHSDSVVSLPSNKHLSVLRISSPDVVHGNRIIAHIAYELVRRISENDGIGNADLVRGVEWILTILGEPAEVLSTERQLGLIGECMLLRRLLTLAHFKSIPLTAALECWKGAAQGLRDFAGSGVAIEAKATSLPTRTHHFGSIEQLDPQNDGEEVFLFSVGLKRDPSAPRKLPEFVHDVVVRLVTPSGEPDEVLRAQFREKLAEYGYDQAKEDYYRACHGFQPPHLPQSLFREAQLERLRKSSLVGGALPGMVVSVSYTLSVTCPPLSAQEAEAAMIQLLGGTSH